MNMNPIEQLAKPKLCVIAPLYTVPFLSTREYVITSLILFYPLYWYYLKNERNLFQFRSLFSSSWFWDFKTSRPAAKKGSEQLFFSHIFEELFLGGQAPSTAPILCCVNLIIWTENLQNLTIRTKT